MQCLLLQAIQPACMHEGHTIIIIIVLYSQSGIPMGCDSINIDNSSASYY